MAEQKTRMGAGGRVVIPAAYRKALGFEEGDEVIVALEKGGLRIFSPAEAVARAQANVRRFIHGNRGLAAELIADRRRETEG